MCQRHSCQPIRVNGSVHRVSARTLGSPVWFYGRGSGRASGSVGGRRVRRGNVDHHKFLGQATLTNTTVYVTPTLRGMATTRGTVANGSSMSTTAVPTKVTTIHTRHALDDNGMTFAVSTVNFNYVKLGRRHDRSPSRGAYVQLVRRTVRQNMALFSATRDCNCRGGRGLMNRTLGNCASHIFISSGFKRGFIGNIRIGARRSDAPAGVQHMYRGSLHGLNIRALNVFCRRHISPTAPVRIMTRAYNRLVQRKGVLR